MDSIRLRWCLLYYHFGCRARPNAQSGLKKYNLVQGSKSKSAPLQTPQRVGTRQQVHNGLEPKPYSLHEVESALDEMVLAERDQFERPGKAYRWKKHYRFAATERK